MNNYWQRIKQEKYSEEEEFDRMRGMYHNCCYICERPNATESRYILGANRRICTICNDRYEEEKEVCREA